MAEPEVRKFATFLEEIHHEGGSPAKRTLCKAAAVAVISNPFAGRHVDDIAWYMDDLKPLGLTMANRLVAALGGEASTVEGYGKGAIVGEDGELEHGALWHVPGGYAMREVLGGAMAIVPSSKKVGTAGTRIDIPITHINASYVRSHFDAMEVGLESSPRRDEICLILVMTTGARIHNRCLGLRAEDVKGEDGLR